jgi:CRISPR/Cas system type I-B associated protein Csh2 (Cas7 group RAMP superfamily)
VQFGPGVSIAPIEIERLTTTNKSGVQEGKDRGMAPLGWRVVRHAVYVMPFFVNPMMAGKSGCQERDIGLLKFLIPHAYRNTASAIRPFVEVRHAWYAEHKSPLGSCPDSLILDTMTPKKIKGKAEEPSTAIDDYEFPIKLDEKIKEHLLKFEDLCTKQWG